MTDNKNHDDVLLTANFLLLCVGSLFFYISFHLLLSTLPTYILAIGGKDRQIGLIIGAFATSSLVFRIPVGYLLDRKGATKGLIVTGTLLFLASSILYGFTRTPATLLMVRLLHGAGMAAYATASSTLVAHITPVHRRGEAMGVFGIASNVSMGLGPLLGVVVLRGSGYHALFQISTVCAVLGLALSLPLKDHKQPVKRAESVTQTFFCKEAVFPSLSIFAACLTYGVVVAFLPIFTARRGLGNPGSFFFIYAMFIMAARRPAGRLSDKYGRAVVIAPGLLALAASMLILAQARSALTLAVAAAIYGLGFACVQSTLMALAIDRTVSERRGAAMGVFTAGWELGIALGSAAFGLVLASYGFAAMFHTAALAAVLGCVGFLVGHARTRSRLIEGK